MFVVDVFLYLGDFLKLYILKNPLGGSFCGFFKVGPAQKNPLGFFGLDPLVRTLYAGLLFC